MVERSCAPQGALQIGRLLGDGVEDAALFLRVFQCVPQCCRLAEHAFEDLARIDLHGLRRGGRAPREVFI